MARPVQRVIFSQLEGGPNLVWEGGGLLERLTAQESDRRRIEADWGDQFSPESWSAVVPILHKYQIGMWRVRSAPTISVLIERFGEVLDKAARLRIALAGAEDVGLAAALQQHLEGFGLLPVTSGVLQHYETALTEVIKSYRTSYMVSRTEGEIWGDLVRDLTLWAMKYGHASGYTRDGDSPPFLRLIRSLEDALPRDCRIARSETWEALGLAIEKAVASLAPPPVAEPARHSNERGRNWVSVLRQPKRRRKPQ